MKRALFFVFVLVMGVIGIISYLQFFRNSEEPAGERKVVPKTLPIQPVTIASKEEPVPLPPYRIIERANGQYISFNGKLRGPFTKVEMANDEEVEIKEIAWDRWTAGLGRVYLFFDCLLKGFDVAYTLRRRVGDVLSIVKSAAGDSGVIYNGTRILPLGAYDFLQVFQNGTSGGLQGQINYFRKGDFGHILINMDRNKMVTQIILSYHSNLREKKAKLYRGFVNGTAIIKSPAGFGLVDLRGVCVVPPKYHKYEEIGTSYYLFTGMGTAIISEREGSCLY